MNHRSSEIQLADPAARRKALVIVLAGTVAGAVVIVCLTFFETRIHAWVESHLDFLTSHPGVVFLAGLLPVSPLIAMSAWFFLYGQRISRARRMPPPGYGVIRDTPVVKGPAAAVRGRTLQVFSVLLLIAALSIPIMLWTLFVRLVR